MNKLIIRKRNIFTLILALLMIVISTNEVYADDGTQPELTQTPDVTPPIVIRQGGPVVVSVPAYQANNSLNAIAATPYRRGSTDAWYVYYLALLQWEHHGSHTSQSDLVEDNIWVDGSINVGSIGIVGSCSNHNSGQLANCGESVTYNWKYQIVSTSYHYFNKAGYTNTNLTTSKTATP